MSTHSTEAIDERFRLLGQHERRCLLRFLGAAETDRVSIDEVVSHLQERDPAPDERDRLAVALYHNHLPRLAEIGAIQFDADSGTVRYDGDELLDALLESSSTRDGSDDTRDGSDD